MHVKIILFIKLGLVSFSFLCTVTYLVLKSTNQGFTEQQNSLQYTLCSSYIREKYAYVSISSLVHNIQLIITLLLQFLMIGKYLLIIFKQKPQHIEDVSVTIWIKIEFILVSVCATFFICPLGEAVSKLASHNQCGTINIDHAIIYIIMVSFALLSIFVLTAINLYLISKNYTQSDDQQQPYYSSQNRQRTQFSKFLQQNQILQNLQNLENQIIFNMDPKQIREKLLREHMVPEGQQDDQMHKFFLHNKNIEQMQRKYPNKLQQKIRKLKQRRALLFGDKQSTNNFTISCVVNEPIVLGPQDQLDPQYDRQKVPEMIRSAVERLKQKDYFIQERPYIEKTIISKKFTIPKTINSDLNRMQKKQNQLKQKKNKKAIKDPNGMNSISEQEEQQIEIIINLDNRQVKQQSQFVNNEEQELIQLDGIFYQQYIEKEKKQKQEIRLRILKKRKQKQLEKSLENSQRLKCSYIRYVDEDQLMDSRYLQAMEYASKTKQYNGLEMQQLALHIKSNKKSKAFVEDINSYFKDQIPENYKYKQEQNENRIKNKRRLTSQNVNLYKDRKNPLEIIRGKDPHL